MSPIYSDEWELPELEPLRKRLEREPGDNLARADLALVLDLRGEREAALEVIGAPLSPGPGRGLCQIQRLYLGLAEEARRALAAQPGEDLGRRIKKILPVPRPTRAPLASVIMPTYNRGGTILPSIRSVLGQTFSDFELVVVNDGGAPGVEGVVQGLGSDRVVYVDADHRGIAGAINLGIHCSRGKYIARLDDDDLYLPSHLAETIGFLQSHPEVPAVYTNQELHVQERRGQR